MRFSISKVQDVIIADQGPNEICHSYVLDVYMNKAHEIEGLIAFRDAITAYIDKELIEKGGSDE